MDILQKALPYQKEKVLKIIQTARVAKANGIVFFGDSIIDGFNLSNYFEQDDLYNCGVKGATTDTILHLFPYAIQDYKPRKVILLVGTNDLSDRYQFDKLEIAFNIFKFLQIMELKLPNCEVVVLSPLPIDENRKRERIKDNNQLQLLGKEIKANVAECTNAQYVEIYDAFKEDGQLKSEYTTDGLHLTKAGYDKLYEVVQEYVK